LSRTLSRTPIGWDQIAIGTATDPYQPAERKFGLTRSMLEVFAQLGGLDLSVTTKSALITRDLDLLRKINERSRLSVNFSLITLNRRLQRILEPRAPRPALRLRALRELSAAGIRCHVLMMPMIPGLTDSPGAIERVVAAAREADAAAVWWRSLFLKPAAARRFIPFIRENFPGHEARIRAFYDKSVHAGASAYAPRSYDEHLREIFERLLRKYHFAGDPGDPQRTRSGRPAASATPPAPVQLSFADPPA